jgi:hypothetical protein
MVCQATTLTRKSDRVTIMRRLWTEPSVTFPSRLSPTSRVEALAPGNSYGFSVTHPARLVQIALCRAMPCCGRSEMLPAWPAWWPSARLAG